MRNSMGYTKHTVAQGPAPFISDKPVYFNNPSTGIFNAG